jgi:hypothetical protein
MIPMGATGIEPLAKPAGNIHVSETGGSKSGNIPTCFGDCSHGDTPGVSTLADPDLAAVVTAWPDLPPAIRAGIVAMVRSTSESFQAN